MSISTSPGPGFGSANLLEPEHVETAELVEHDRFHALDLLDRSALEACVYV